MFSMGGRIEPKSTFCSFIEDKNHWATQSPLTEWLSCLYFINEQGRTLPMGRMSLKYNFRLINSLFKQVRAAGQHPWVQPGNITSIIVDVWGQWQYENHFRSSDMRTILVLLHVAITLLSPPRFFRWGNSSIKHWACFYAIPSPPCYVFPMR